MADVWSADDFDKTVRTVWGEAGQEPAEGQRAVAAVIANRARAANKSLTDIVLAPNQFEPWGARRGQLEGLSASSPEYQRIAETIRPVLYGGADDPTGGATHFYGPKSQAALGRAPPSWDNGTGLDIGNHRFFKLGYGGAPATSSPLAQTLRQPMPIDEQSGLYVPEEAIKQQYGLANRFASTPQATGPAGALAQALGGAFGGLTRGNADQALIGNQQMQSKALRDAMTAPDLKTSMATLLRSGVPGLEMKGAGIMEQLGLKQQETQEKFNMLQRLFPGSGAPGAAAPASPGSPSGVPGVSVGGGAPASDGFRGSGVDNRYLAAAAAAGLLPKEALELLQPRKGFENSFDKQSGEDYAKYATEIRENAKKLQPQMANYDVMEALIKNPATVQGWGSSAGLQLRRVADSFGIKTEGLAPTQVMQALGGALALQLRNPAGGAGMPGSLSDSDRNFLTSMTASISSSPEANLFLIGLSKRVAQREMDVTRLAGRYMQNNEGRLDHNFSAMLQKWSDEHPLFNPDEMKALAGQKQAVSASGEPAAGVAGAPSAQPQPQDQPRLAKADYEAMPVGQTIDHPEHGRLIKGADGKFRPLTQQEKVGDVGKAAGDMMDDIKAGVANSPAANLARWLVSNYGKPQQGTSEPLPPTGVGMP